MKQCQPLFFNQNLVAAKVWKLTKSQTKANTKIYNLNNEDTALDYNLEKKNCSEKLTEEWIIQHSYPDEIWNEMKIVYMEPVQKMIGRKI